MSSSRSFPLNAASRHLAIAVLVTLVPSFPAFAQKRAASQGAASPPAVVVGLLAERVPATMNFYVELAGAKSDAERAAVDELYNNLVAGFGSIGGGPAPITLEEFQMLAASNIAIAFQMPDSAGRSSSTQWLGIIRTPAAATAAQLASKVVAFARPSATGPKTGGSVSVRGRKLIPLSSSITAESPFYTVADDTILIGDRASIDRALDGAPAAVSSSLASTPLYRDGRARVGEDAGLLTVMTVTQGIFGKPDAEGAEPSMATVFGLPSLRGIVSGSEPWTQGAPGVTVFAFEKDKRNVLTILAGGPAVTLRPAELLPADTGIVTSFALDLPALEALLRPSKAAKDSGFDIAALERQVGMSLRDQLLPALGNEFAVGVRFEVPPATMSMNGEGATHTTEQSPEMKVVVLVEAKQLDVVRSAFERALAATSPSEPTVRDVGGVRMASAGNVAVAVVDGVAMIGEPDEVERVLQARSVEQTLGTSRELDESRSRLDGDTLAVVHPTPALRDTLSTYASSFGGMFSSQLMGLSNLDDTVVRREPLGLSITTGGGSAFSAAALGIVAAIAIPSLFRARGAANEAAAIGTLRSLASAQATFQAKHGRFGTMAELADADMIAPELRNGVERNGYVFREVRPTAKTFEFSAAPVGAASGDNSYNIVEDFVVRYSESKVPPRRKAGKPIG